MLASSGKIIVIAPDLGLRQSLTFALEVEGYQVEAHDTWNKNCIPATPALCVIIDEQVLRRGRDDAWRRLRNSGQAIILLTDGISPPVKDNPGLTLTKPFDGADLVKLLKRLGQTA